MAANQRAIWIFSKVHFTELRLAANLTAFLHSNSLTFLIVMVNQIIANNFMFGDDVTDPIEILYVTSLAPLRR